MQCYLSGHSDGSLDSVDPSTEGSSSAETPSAAGPSRVGVGGGGSGDRDSGIMDDKFDTFVEDSTSPPAEREAGPAGVAAAKHPRYDDAENFDI